MLDNQIEANSKNQCNSTSNESLNSRMGSKIYSKFGSSEFLTENKTWLFGLNLGCPVCQSNQMTLASNLNGQTKLMSSNSSENIMRDLHTRLHGVSLECTLLRSELEALHKAFNSKCEAVKILTLNNSNSVNENDRDRNKIHDSTIELKKEISKLKVQIELGKGALLSQQQASDARIQYLVDIRENLTRQLENLQLKTGQLLEENMRLLEKITKLSQVNLHDKTEENSTVFEQSSPLCLDKYSLNCLSDTDVPLTSEAILCTLEEQCNSEEILRQTENSSCKTILPVHRPTIHNKLNNDNITTTTSVHNTTTVTASTLNSIFNRLRLDKQNQGLSLSKSKSTFAEQSSQCDLITPISGLICRSNIRIPIDCACDKYPNLNKPCLCAQTALRIQRDLLRFKCHIESLSTKLQKCEGNENAYRFALENSLSRNRDLSSHLSSLLQLLPADFQTKVKNLSPWISTEVSGDTTKSFHELLLWFRKVLQSTAVSLNKLVNPTKPYLSDSRSKYALEQAYLISSIYPKAKKNFKSETEFTHLSLNEAKLKDADRPFDNYGLFNKSSFGTSNEQITLASRRRINRRSTRSRPKSITYMPTMTSNEGLDDETDSNHDLIPPAESTSWSPDVYHRKISCSSSKRAERLKSRTRSMDHLISAGTKCDDDVNTILLSQLLLKMNDICELITKQQLIYDKAVSRSASARL